MWRGNPREHSIGTHAVASPLVIPSAAGQRQLKVMKQGKTSIVSSVTFCPNTDESPGAR